jgi:hypothetical protein
MSGIRYSNRDTVLYISRGVFVNVFKVSKITEEGVP